MMVPGSILTTGELTSNVFFNLSHFRKHSLRTSERTFKPSVTDVVITFVVFEVKGANLRTGEYGGGSIMVLKFATVTSSYQDGRNCRWRGVIYGSRCRRPLIRKWSSAAHLAAGANTRRRHHFELSAISTNYVHPGSTELGIRVCLVQFLIN
ncbi:hypothetical protein EVAR_55881_1 [Eumeta japonica]|uniref:Uncharacterized protein n=1 Tax=Eumeta variegata TaxID=151549 RepID=A0A4C1YMQ9_EUMVA|nr:hypothetical protein EVAR_55881_1 [Eumeta japonica]